MPPTIDRHSPKTFVKGPASAGPGGIGGQCRPDFYKPCRPDFH